MNKKLIGIVQVIGNSEGKIKIIDLRLDAIKDRVMKDELGDGSNLPPATNHLPFSLIACSIDTGSTKGASTRMVISPLVAQRIGHSITKRKVAKVDQIVNRFKAMEKKKIQKQM
ncbi:hypothetical protein CsSME_00037718 [Camellia sinensis var. sinensis]